MGVMRELQAIAKELEAMKANSGRTPTSGNSEVILTPAESPDPSLPSVQLLSPTSSGGSPGAPNAQKALSEIRAELEEISTTLSPLVRKQAISQARVNESAPVKTLDPSPLQDGPLPSVDLSGEPSRSSFPKMEKPETRLSSIGRHSYLIIRPRIHFSPDLSYHGFSSTGTIKTNAGIGLSLDLSRDFGGFEIGASLGFAHTGLEDITLPGDSFAANGDAHHYHLSLLLGYRWALGERVVLKTGTNLGFASRHTLYDIDTLGYSLADQSVVFLGELHLALSFDLSERAALFAGYRFSYLGDAGAFGDTHQHGLEFGSEWKW